VRLKLVTPPSVEPVTLAEAKLYLRVVDSTEDAMISSMITAARVKCEAEFDRCFINTTWDLFFDGWPNDNAPIPTAWPGLVGTISVVRFPRANLVSVDAVNYVDGAGITQLLDPSAYLVATGAPGMMMPAYLRTWPPTRIQLGSVVIRFTAGYGATADDVPITDKQAVLMMTAMMYENRGESAFEVPKFITDLLAAGDWGSYS